MTRTPSPIMAGRLQRGRVALMLCRAVVMSRMTGSAGAGAGAGVGVRGLVSMLGDTRIWRVVSPAVLVRALSPGESTMSIGKVP